MSIYDLYESDTDLEENGVWITTISDPEQFKIASARNKKALEYSAKLLRPKAAEIRRAQRIAERPGGKVPEAINEFIQEAELKTFCQHILRDWRNVTDREGKEIPYSPEAAYALLSDQRMRRLKEALFEEAERQANFVAEQNASTEKNSVKPSDGTSNGDI